VTDVAFEGNFISVHAVTDSGAALLAELRNDGSSPIPNRGDKLHMSFAAERASILPDGLVRGA
jgi:spermidine/putrescine transport system ATP-binding protein